MSFSEVDYVNYICQRKIVFFLVQTCLMFLGTIFHESSQGGTHNEKSIFDNDMDNTLTNSNKDHLFKCICSITKYNTYSLTRSYNTGHNV